RERADHVPHRAALAQLRYDALGVAEAGALAVRQAPRVIDDDARLDVECALERRDIKKAGLDPDAEVRFRPARERRASALGRAPPRRSLEWLVGDARV